MRKLGEKSKLILRKIIFLSLLILINGCSNKLPQLEYPREDGGLSIETFPEFPWPPPQASASMIIPELYLQDSEGGITLGNVCNKLKEALDGSGYGEKSFYAVPGGFAIVARIEQINSDGTPKEPGRWDLEIGPLQEFSLVEYLEKLFFANPGLFRIVVFVVTPHPFSQSEEVIDQNEAMSWLRKGWNSIPSIVAAQVYTNEFTTTALIYEFKKPESGEPTLSTPSNLTGRIHLENSGIVRQLEDL